MTIFNIRKAIATVAIAAATLSAHAGIEINGEVSQVVDSRTLTVTAGGIGPMAVAKARINTIEGDVKVQGPVKQQLTARTATVTAVGIGPGAKALAEVNTISSK